MNRPIAVAVALALLAATGQSGDLDAQRALRVTPVVGAALFLSEPPSPFVLDLGDGGDLEITNGRFRDALTAGAMLGVHLSPTWEIETFFLFAPSKLQAEEGLGVDNVDATAYMYGANVNYHFPVDLTVGPYVALGVGGEAWDYDIPGASLHNRLMLQGGTGIDLPITDSFSLRLDLRDSISRFGSGTPDTRGRQMHHVLVTAGVTFIRSAE